MRAGHYHAVIWIDHREARIFHIGHANAEGLMLHPEHPTKHIHHKANSVGSGHAPADRAFLESVATGASDAEALLIAGPGSAKTELVTYIQEQHPKLAKAIVGVETTDHPTDGQIVAMAKKHFKATDRMQPQMPS